MATPIQHPTPDQLEAFLGDQLDHECQRSVDVHLAGCQQCRTRVNSICEGEDGFAARIADIASRSTLGFGFGDTQLDHARHPDTKTYCSDVTALDVNDRYQIEYELGRGGMGVVYAGYDRTFDRHLVLKVLNAQDQHDREAVDRFLAEAKICGSLQHPGITPVHDLGFLDDRRPFFSMKRVEGQDLAECLRARTSPDADQSRYLDIFIQVCQAVAYAHSQRIIHRDLKPSNVMIGKYGEVQVLDWGLAKRLGELNEAGGGAGDAGVRQTNGSHTVRGQVMGTPAYMSPEQATGQNEIVDQRSDVFSLGAMLCEIITGDPPYVENEDRPLLEQARRANLDDAYQRLDVHGEDEELIHFAKQCLSPNAANRPTDASCVATALADYRESVVQRLRQMEVQSAQQNARRVELMRRRRQLLVGGTVIVVLAASLLLGYQYHLRKTREGESRFTAATEHGRQLQSALTTEQDELSLAMRLADTYQGDELRSMLGHYRSAAHVCRPRDAADVVMSEGEQNATFDAAVFTPEKEFVQRLFAAHVWKVAFSEDADRQRCLAEANREYAATFAVFAQWHVPGSVPVPQAVSAIQAYPLPTQQVVVNAIDDWLQIRQLQLSVHEDEIAEAWLVKVANQLDTNDDRRRLRQMIVRRDAQGILDFSHSFIMQDASSVLLHMLVVALESIGEKENSRAILNNSRRLHGDDFWLAGRVIASDTTPENRKSTPPATTSESELVEVFLLAREQARKKDFESSCAIYCRLFRDRELVGRAMTAKQLDYVLAAWKEMANAYPPALAELKTLRDEYRVAARQHQDVTAFRMMAALNRALGETTSTVECFRQFDQNSPDLARTVFSLAEADLLSSGEHAIVAKYARHDRVFPRIVGVHNSHWMGGEQRQFESLLTLIALYMREGRQREAVEIAADAKIIWTAADAHEQVDGALSGELPLAE